MFNHEKIAESEDEIAARLKSMLSEKNKGKSPVEKLQIMDDTATFAERLGEKYPDPTSYRLFHLLAHSGQLPDVPFEHFDFPGEDSVQAFIERM